MQSPVGRLELDQSAQANQSAEVGRSRSGLFGFFRPHKTVSPSTQQGPQDLGAAVLSRTMPVGHSRADNGQEACPEPDSDSAWSTLPEHLIEAIMHMLQEDSSAPLQHSNKETIQVLRILSSPNSLPHNRMSSNINDHS